MLLLLLAGSLQLLQDSYGPQSWKALCAAFVTACVQGFQPQYTGL